MGEFPKITGSSLGSNARVLTVQLRGFGATGDDDGAAPFDAAEAVQPLGLTARPKPTDTLEAVTLDAGEELLVVAMVDKGIATKLGDDPSLEEGETRLHGAKAENVAAMLRIKANGDIVIVPKSGQKLYLGGDSSTQPTPLGTDLNNYLSDLKDAINACRSDLASVKTHTHPASSGTTSASLTLTTLPTANSQGSPPSLSSTVENK